MMVILVAKWTVFFMIDHSSVINTRGGAWHSIAESTVQCSVALTL